jgi:hypothetical protein
MKKKESKIDWKEESIDQISKSLFSNIEGLFQ